jgi:rubrerythrin
LGGVNIHTLSHLEEAMHQKEQALIMYVRYMREAQDSENQEMAALFADLAKAEEKHIAVIRDQVAKYSDDNEVLNKYEQINQDNSQDSSYQH